MNRRDFLKNSGIIAAAATLSPVMTHAETKPLILPE